MGEDKLEAGALFISLLISYEGIAFILGSATILASASDFIGGIYFTGFTTAVGLMLLVLAWGIYEEKEWAWFITFPGFILLMTSDILILGTEEFSGLNAAIHVAVTGYLVWVREDFGFERF